MSSEFERKENPVAPRHLGGTGEEPVAEYQLQRAFDTARGAP